MNIRIMSWNIACLPKKLNIFRDPHEKLNKILDKIYYFKPDILSLQEVFCYKIQDKIVESLNKNNYNTAISESNKFISKNGLLNASLFPLEYYNTHNFEKYTGPEMLIEKGILTSIIKPTFDSKIILHNTHLQSDSMGPIKQICRKYRNIQKNSLILYTSQFKSLNVIAGDLNDDINTLNHTQFINNFPYENLITNKNKIITFPSTQEQLDYIIFNENLYTKYFTEDVFTEKLSDHNPLLCDFSFN